MSLRITNPQAPGQVLWRKFGLWLGVWLRVAAVVAGIWLFLVASALSF